MDAPWPIARRATRVDASGIRRIWELAASVRDPIDFSIGQPDFDMPEPAREAAVRAVRAGHSGYTVTQGLPELREAVAAHVARTRGFTPEAVLITSGVSGGLTLAFMALLDEGDSILIPDPYFVIYRQVPAFLGARVVPVDTYPDFRLRPERVEAAAGEGARVLLLNSPSNPTGAVYPEGDLRAVAEIAARHNMVVIADEIYDTFTYDRPHASIAPLYEGTLLLGGMSKTLGMPGWRLGYAAGPKALIDRMATLQQYTFVCAPHVAQRAAAECLSVDVSEHVSAYRRRRDLLCDGLDDAFELVRPGGAFYAFPRAPWGTDEQFVEAAIAAGVLVIPGSVFSSRNTHFRIAYAVPEATIEKGIAVLNRLAARGGPAA
jgi:aspartate aminotransferase/aminotransferase